MDLWSINLQQQKQKYTIKMVSLSISGAGKTR